MTTQEATDIRQQMRRLRNERAVCGSDPIHGVRDKERFMGEIVGLCNILEEAGELGYVKGEDADCDRKAVRDSLSCPLDVAIWDLVTHFPEWHEFEGPLEEKILAVLRAWKPKEIVR